MKKRDLNDLRKKSIEELVKKVESLKSEMLETKAKVKAGKEKNLKKAKNLKVDISQIQTIIRQKQITEKNDIKKEKEVKK